MKRLILILALLVALPSFAVDKQHNALTTSDNHALHYWDTDDCEADLTPVAADVGRLCKQQNGTSGDDSDDTYWLLLDNSPETWIEVTSSVRTGIADDQVFIGTGSNAGTYESIPDCTAGTQSLRWVTATNAWACETITGGATPMTEVNSNTALEPTTNTIDWIKLTGDDLYAEVPAIGAGATLKEMYFSWPLTGTETPNADLTFGKVSATNFFFDVSNGSDVTYEFRNSGAGDAIVVADQFTAAATSNPVVNLEDIDLDDSDTDFQIAIQDSAGNDTTADFYVEIGGTMYSLFHLDGVNENIEIGNASAIGDTVFRGSGGIAMNPLASPSTNGAGECGFDTNAWATDRGSLQCYDGTANTYAVMVQSDSGLVDGYVPKWNTGGTITWQADTGAGGVDLVDDGDGVTATTASESGMEVMSGELGLIRGCSDTEVLAWQNSTQDWACSAGGGGSGDNITVNGSAATNADFDDADPAAAAGDVNIKWQLNTTPSPDSLSAYLDLALIDGNGLAVSGNELAVELLTADDLGATVQSDSGLEFYGNKLGLLQGCADNQILKWDETQDDWNCEADDGGGGGEANTYSSSGGGLAVIGTKSGVDLPFSSFSSSDFALATNLFTINDTNWATQTEVDAKLPLAGGTVTGIINQKNIIDMWDAAGDGPAIRYQADGQTGPLWVMKATTGGNMVWQTADASATQITMQNTDGGGSFKLKVSGTFESTTIQGNLADPGDDGYINLSNSQSICWEASPTGADVCLQSGADEVVDVTGGTLMAGDIACNNCIAAGDMGTDSVAASEIAENAVGSSEINLGGTFAWTGTNTFDNIAVQNAEGDSVLAAAGRIATDGVDDTLSFHAGAGGEVSGEVSLSAIQHISKGFSPKNFYDNIDQQVFLMTVGDDAPNGITIDEWKVSCETASPTTEFSADLERATAFTTLGTPVVMDVLDTASGTSSEDTDSNINSDAVVANGQVIYIDMAGHDPGATNCKNVLFEMWYHAEED